MALEQSVLTAESMRMLLNGHYGLQMREAERLPLGTANCYRVQTEIGPVFLKEFQAGFDRDALAREARLTEHLAACGVPTARFLRTITGGTCFVYEGHSIVLEAYVEGETFDYEDFPPERLSSLARMLGKIHRALAEEDLPEDMGREWLDSYSPEEAAARYDRLMRLAGERADDPNILEVLCALGYKKELACRAEEHKKYFSGITYGGTHGDYQGCQTVWEGEDIRAVIDFSSARRLPLVWEIMRSFVQSSRTCRQECTVDTDGLCRYVAEYLKESPLTETDLAAMPYVYLFQLARSRYGFNEYLTTHSEDRDSLLRFALWRTEMCRYLEEHGKEIAEKLLELKH